MPFLTEKQFGSVRLKDKRAITDRLIKEITTIDAGVFLMRVLSLRLTVRGFTSGAGFEKQMLTNKLKYMKETKAENMHTSGTAGKASVSGSASDDRITKAEDYLEFQKFNTGSMLPGWRSRMDKTWGGNKADF